MKTTLIIVLTLVASYLLVWQSVGLFTLIKGFNKKERQSINRWFLTISLIGLFGITTEWFIFPLAWWTRKQGRDSWFWWWMDDSRYDKNRPLGLTKDFEVFLDGRKETFWLSYKWHMRNRIWNLWDKLQPKQTSNLKVVKMISDNLIMNDKKIDQTLSWAPMARLKYWKSGKEGSQVNNGAFISKRHSIFGDGDFWYSDDSNLYFRYSILKIVRPFYFLWLWRGYRTIQMGTNAKRHVSTIKHQNIKKII